MSSLSSQFLQKSIAFWLDLDSSRCSYDAVKAFCIKRTNQDEPGSNKISQEAGMTVGKSKCTEWIRVRFWLPQGYGVGQS